MSVRAVRQLLVVILVIVAIHALVAKLWAALGSATANRAFSLVFVVGGGIVLLFALITVGAERRAWGTTGDRLISRSFAVGPDERIALDPSGAFAVAGLVCIALSIVFTIVL